MLVQIYVSRISPKGKNYAATLVIVPAEKGLEAVPRQFLEEIGGKEHLEGPRSEFELTEKYKSPSNEFDAHTALADIAEKGFHVVGHVLEFK